MTVQYINTGSSPNKGDGDSLRAAFTKINSNFAEIYSVAGDINSLDDSVGHLLETSQQIGLSVTYNTGSNQVSFILNTATTTSIGGIKVGDNLLLDENGFLHGYVLPLASPSTIGGAKTSDTILVNGSGQFVAYSASKDRKGVVQVGAGISVSLDSVISVDFGDIVITGTTITTRFPDQDIIFQPNTSTSTSRVRLVNQPLQFDNGIGGSLGGHLIYTNPISAAGIGIGETNNSIRISGDTVTLGLVTDFGLYNAIRGTWNSLITIDYLGNMAMHDGDIVFNKVNKGIQFYDGSRQTTAYIPSQSTAITTTSINPPSTVSTGTTWYDPTSGRWYIYYDASWIDASPAGGGGGGTVSGSFISNSDGVTTYSISIGPNGTISYPGDIKQNYQDNTSCPTEVDTVIYTSTGQYQHAIKLFVMVEGSQGGAWETQACDIIAVKGFVNNIVHVTAYGVTYSGTTPLATFDGQWNAISNKIEITCLPTSTSAGVTSSVHAIEMTTND